MANYIGRHWRGELSLPVSYWVNGALVSAGYVVAVRLLPGERLISAVPKSYALAMLCLWLMLGILTLWQVVGIWRAANRYLQQGSSRVWGNLARLAVVLNFAQVAALLVEGGMAQIAEYARIAVGRDAIGTYSIRVLRDSTELEISGAITHGLTRDVERVLDKHPAIRLIHLNSDGGRVGEARNLRDLIEARGLSTYTASSCQSACTIAYAAGRDRLIAKNARLGFHQYSFPGASPEAFRGEYEKDRRDWLKRGFSEYFVAKAFAVPHSEMWNPIHQELFRWNVITKHAEDDEVALTGGSVGDLEAALDRALSSNPMLLALKEHDAESYKRISSSVRAGLKGGKTLRELTEEAYRAGYEAVHRKLPYASNSALRRLAAAQRDEVYALTARPTLCYTYVYRSEPDPGFDPAKYFTEPMIREHYSSLGAALRSTAEGRKPPTRQQVEKSLDMVSREIRSRHKTDVRSKQGQHVQAADSNMCALAYDFLEAVLRLSEEDSGAILRWLYVPGNS